MFLCKVKDKGQIIIGIFGDGKTYTYFCSAVRVQKIHGFHRLCKRPFQSAKSIMYFLRSVDTDTDIIKGIQDLFCIGLFDIQPIGRKIGYDTQSFTACGDIVNIFSGQRFSARKDEEFHPIGFKFRQSIHNVIRTQCIYGIQVCF